MAGKGKGYSKDGKAPYNMSAIFYLRLDKNCYLKDVAFLRGDVEGYFRALKIIYRQIIFKIPSDNKDGLKSKDWFQKSFADCENLLYVSLGTGRAAELQADLNVSRALSELEEIDNELTLVMDFYEMIFPNINLDGKGLEYLDRRYGL